MPEGSLRITESATIEIDAISAKLHLTISGENFIYGNAAVEKCKEVRNFVERAKVIGVSDEAIKIKSVRVVVNSGLLTKNSSGVYNLELRVANLGKIGDLLGAVAEQKSITLDLLEWVYNEEEAKLLTIEHAMKKAKKKAELMMSAVGHKVVGIRTCSEHIDSPETSIAFAPSPHAMSKVRAAVASRSADVGTEFKSAKEVKAEVSLDFIILPI